MVRKITTLIFTLFFLTTQLVVNGQSNYIRTFEGVETGYNSHIKSLPDGGMVVLADKADNTLWAMRYDACDELKWSKQFSYSEDLLSADLAITEEGEILVTGYYNEEGVYEGFLFKLRSDGELVFSNTFQTGSDNYYIYSTGQLQNGNYFVYGNMNTVGGPLSSNFILVFNQSGKVVSGNSYFEIPIWGRTIATSDGGILARTGRLIYKVDASGSFLWGKEISGNGYYESVPVEVEGGYIYARYSNASDQEKPGYLIKVSYNGELIWVSDGIESINMTHFTELNNGNLLVPGNMSIDSLGTASMFKVYHLFDGNGKLLGQWRQQPDSNESYMTQSIHSGLNNTVYQVSRVSSPQLLSISRMEWNNGPAACKLVPFSARMPVENITLTDKSIVPHSLGVSIEPLPLIITNQPAVFSQSCYEKQELTLNIGNDSSLCSGQSLVIGSDREYPAYNWSNGSKERYIEISESGSYWLETGNGCEFIHDTVTVNYYPESELLYEIEPRNTNPLEPVNFKSMSANAVSVQWSFAGNTNGQADFDFYFSENGSFPVVYSFTDKFGCTYSDTSEVFVRYSSVYIPNGFTPDGDGINDVFMPVGHGIRKYHMNIYTRWGDIIYSDQNGSWDGKFKGKTMPQDGYVYEIKLYDDFGKDEVKRGVITLIK